jgi:hypothetical protein
MSTDTQVSTRAAPQRPSASSGSASPGLPKKPALSVVVIDNWADLEPYTAAWDALAASAIEPNVYYESWMLRPALDLCGADTDLRLVLVVADLPPGSPHAPLVCGLFPLERLRGYKGLPASTYYFWQYAHCFLCTPLIHAAYASATLDTFFDWLAHDRRGAPLLACQVIPGEGPFRRLLSEHLEERPKLSLVEDAHVRALFCPRASARVYLEGALSSERRRRLRRHEERLREQGPVEYDELRPGGDVATWLEEFLRLEASGWKGREGTALQCRETDRRFFLTAFTEAFRRGRLMLFALRLGGKPVAMLCDLACPQGGYVFKLAFDETHAACSPGVLLEMEFIRRAHERPELRWVDSCNAPGPALLKDLWADRRVIETVLVAPGKAPGPLCLSALPLLRWMRRKLVGVLRLFRRRGKA